MTIETYRDCDIDFNGYTFEWGHPDYDGPQDVDDMNYYPSLCGAAMTIKECYEQIDELHDELEAEKKEAAEAIREDLHDDFRKGIE